MDINKALTYVTEDEGWVTKILIGAVMALFSFLIIPGIILLGYGIAISRNVMQDEERPLPEWHDWGGMFMDGLYLTIAYLVYLLPVWLLMCCGIIAVFSGGLMEGTAGGDAGGLLAGMGAATMGLMFCLMIIVLIAFMFIAPAITIQYVKEGSLGGTMQVGEVLGMARDNLGDILLTLVVTFALSFVIGLVAIIPVIGWLIALAGNVYVVAVTYHLYGQIGAKVGGLPKADKFVG